MSSSAAVWPPVPLSDDSHDPICEAARQLRQAASVPFYADVADLWAVAFERQIRRALHAFEAHVRQSERADSAVSRVHAARPGFRPSRVRQTEEHAALDTRFQHLRREIECLSTPDVWSMVDLRECALRLERAVRRHHRRLLAVVHGTADRRRPAASLPAGTATS